MKSKKLFFLGGLLLPLLSFSQTDYTNYEMSYFEKKNIYKIQVSEDKQALDRVWIDAFSMDGTSKEGSLIIDAKKLEGFKEYLNFAKAKYLEWEKTAKENNVKELDKEIEFDGKRQFYSAAFSYGKWHFDYSVPLKYRFKIVDGKYLLIISTGELNSSSNQFIDSDGIVIVFSNENEIQEFIDKLNVAKMEEIFKNNTKKDDLFK